MPEPPSPMSAHKPPGPGASLVPSTQEVILTLSTGVARITCSRRLTRQDAERLKVLIDLMVVDVASHNPQALRAEERSPNE